MDAIVISKGNSTTARNVRTWEKNKAKRDQRDKKPAIDPKYIPRKVKRG